MAAADRIKTGNTSPRRGAKGGPEATRRTENNRNLIMKIDSMKLNKAAKDNRDKKIRHIDTKSNNFKLK